MEVSFDNQRLKRDCESEGALRRKFGPERASKIAKRIKQLKSAEALDDLRGPGFGRCHELTGDMAGLLSVDLDGPYRLIFRPDNDDARKPDGGLDWGNVTAVVIVGIADPH